MRIIWIQTSLPVCLIIKHKAINFTWFEAILNLTKTSEEDLSFENVIDEMICEAAYSDALSSSTWSDS